jgi:hypothetical protein
MFSATKSVVELLAKRVNQLAVKNDNDLVSQLFGCFPLVLKVLNLYIPIWAGFSFGWKS